MHTSSQLWHSRLGHPSFHTNNLILHRFKMPLTFSTILLPCFACAHVKAQALPIPHPHLGLLVLFNFFLWMYEALLQFYFLIVHVITYQLLIIIPNFFASFQFN